MRESVRSSTGPPRSSAPVRIFGPCKSDRKSTRLNSSHDQISYAVFCLKKKKEYSILSLAEQSDTASNSRLAHIECLISHRVSQLNLSTYARLLYIASLVSVHHHNELQ